MAAVIANSDLDARPNCHGALYPREEPFCARAALTLLQIIEEDGLVAHAAELGAHAMTLIVQMARRQPLVRGARGRGLLFAIAIQPAGTAKPLAEIVEFAVLAHPRQGRESLGERGP
jgi:4-aminobutyrate aminotransferase